MWSRGSSDIGVVEGDELGGSSWIGSKSRRTRSSGADNSTLEGAATPRTLNSRNLPSRMDPSSAGTYLTVAPSSCDHHSRGSSSICIILHGLTATKVFAP